MCFRQKTESSLLDGCHNTLQFCPEVVRIVLPCKKYCLYPHFLQQTYTACITHISFRSQILNCGEPLFDIVSLYCRRTKGRMVKKKLMSLRFRHLYN